MKYLALWCRLCVYGGVFFYELVKASLQVAKAVLSPRFQFKSAAIKFHSKVKTNAELILLTNSITLTPGTLVMDATLEKGEILVHVMSTESVRHVNNELKKFPEEKVIWALREKT